MVELIPIAERIGLNVLTRIILMIIAIVMFVRVNPDLVESIFEYRKWE